MADTAPLCPSAPPDPDGGVAIGVVDRTGPGPRVRWIEEPVPVTPALLAMAGEVSPRSVFRFAATCQERACQHFDGVDCRLATRIVAALEPVADRPPPCLIRADCRWYRQEGVAACRRCPQVVTEYSDPDATLIAVAWPEARAAA